MIRHQLINLYHIIAIFPCLLIVNGTVLPPPWANPKLNPCALQPNGWQLLYWPPDGKCYRIFKMGYPCPDDMELSPLPINSGEFSAECRCPPMKAQSARDGKCYELYTRGPCNHNYYFAPDTKYQSTKRQWGICVQFKSCKNPNELFWPKDGKCYQKLTKGPCQKGQLFNLNLITNFSECTCDNLKDYQYNGNGKCYQYFTKGPCNENGQLFLPDRTCGCYQYLPHYHIETKQCYEIGNIGPCNFGEIYQLNQLKNTSECQCKNNYIRYWNSTKCYRLYTQGPCNNNFILINTTTCIKQPCERGYLYYPNKQKCYRIGNRGPCNDGEIFTFDFTTRPSIDGISYNGVCDCVQYNNNHQCVQNNNNKTNKIVCDRRDGLVAYQNHCYKLYQQGPCQKGAWIVPKRHKKSDSWIDNNNNNNDGYCECIPGYTKMIRNLGDSMEISCIPPTVILANYLNNNKSTNNNNNNNN